MVGPRASSDIKKVKTAAAPWLQAGATMLAYSGPWSAAGRAMKRPPRSWDLFASGPKQKALRARLGAPRPRCAPQGWLGGASGRPFCWAFGSQHCAHPAAAAGLI
eukprot:11298273-Alexandrium_andersonii.AAC.1